jgi:signal peptidase II
MGRWVRYGGRQGPTCYHSSMASWFRPALWFLGIAVAAGGCDLSTKSWAERTLTDAGGSLAVIDPWLELSLVYNRGTAFSVIPHLGDARWLFAALALAVCTVLFVMAIRRRPVRRLELLALGITAGGALGNGYDRVFRITPAGDTGVVDFIRVNLTSSYSWPTFNVADAWIAIGVALLLWASWRSAEQAGPEQAGPEPLPSG